jgi:hypothetical protein
VNKDQQRDIVRKIDDTTQISLTKEITNVFMLHFESYETFRSKFIPNFVYAILDKYGWLQNTKPFYKKEWTCFGHRTVIYDRDKERFFYPVDARTIFTTIFHHRGEEPAKLPEPQEAGVSLAEVIGKATDEYKAHYEKTKSTQEALNEMLEEARNEE